MRAEAVDTSAGRLFNSFPLVLILKRLVVGHFHSVDNGYAVDIRNAYSSSTFIGRTGRGVGGSRVGVVTSRVAERLLIDVYPCIFLIFFVSMRAGAGGIIFCQDVFMFFVASRTHFQEIDRSTGHFHSVDDRYPVDIQWW